MPALEETTIMSTTTETATVRIMDTTIVYFPDPEQGALPRIYIDVPEPSFLNGMTHQIGPFTPDEMRLLAVHLLAAADRGDAHGYTL